MRVAVSMCGVTGNQFESGPSGYKNCTAYRTCQCHRWIAALLRAKELPFHKYSERVCGGEAVLLPL